MNVPRKHIVIHTNITCRLEQHANYSIEEWIKHVAAEKTRMLEFKALPYPIIKSKWVTDETNYQCAFNYIHFHIAENETGVNDNTPVYEYEKINIPMLITVSREQDTFLITAAAHQKSVDHFAFNKFWELFIAAVDQIGEGTEALEQAPLRLTKADELQLKEWNQTAPAYPIDTTLHQLFEAQVAKTPDAIALYFEEEKVSYAELNGRANGLALTLQNTYRQKTGSSLQADTRIAMYLDRSIEMVVSMLAILKSGGVFVPLSTEHPQERINYLVQDANAARKVLLFFFCATTIAWRTSGN